MIQDPYRVLGLTPDASDDEVKAAYRKLAKKYHPDVNGGSSGAEAKMKEINAAYSQIMNRHANPAGQQGNGSAGNWGNGSAGNWGNGSADGDWGGWGNWAGWWQQQGYGGAGGNTGGYGGARTQESPQMQAARNYIRSGHYREALNLLENMQDRPARWYFYMAAANAGLGNDIAALNYARQAVSMEPDNLEYRQLLQRLQYPGRAYQFTGRRYGMPTMNNACTWLCLSQLLLSCCCGSRRSVFCC